EQAGNSEIVSERGRTANLDRREAGAAAAVLCFGSGDRGRGGGSPEHEARKRALRNLVRPCQGKSPGEPGTKGLLWSEHGRQQPAQADGEGRVHCSKVARSAGH